MSAKPPSTTSFDQTIAIDWSGAKGKTQKGIAVALCERGKSGRHQVSMINPSKGDTWSRESLCAWLIQHLQHNHTLVGFDFSFSLPFLDYDRYLPSTGFGAETARDLWHEIDHLCATAPNFEGHNFVNHYSDCFLQSAGRVGDLFVQYGPRLRITEQECMHQGLGRAESSFHLIGPTQVGLSSFSGMRVLKELTTKAELSIWPFDNPISGQSVAVEIYTRLFLTMAGVGRKKLQHKDEVIAALNEFSADLILPLKPLDDHHTDALVSAAGMMSLALESKAWTPAKLSDTVRKTEGWTFGVL